MWQLPIIQLVPYKVSPTRIASFQRSFLSGALCSHRGTTIATMSFIIMLSNAIAVALRATRACCSFLLNYPESAGYNTLTEPNAPCGGADANIEKSNMTFWNVGGGSIYLTSEYKVTDYLFRATLDANLTDGWVNLFLILQQNGIGDFCLPSVPVPDSFNGQTGVLQVIANTTDGLFYQVNAVLDYGIDSRYVLTCW
jgi:hypothetical protein